MASVMCSAEVSNALQEGIDAGFGLRVPGLNNVPEDEPHVFPLRPDYGEIETEKGNRSLPSCDKELCLHHSKPLSQ